MIALSMLIVVCLELMVSVPSKCSSAGMARLYFLPLLLYSLPLIRSLLLLLANVLVTHGPRQQLTAVENVFIARVT